MKAIGGVALGYVMMFAFVFLSLSFAYRLMGADRAFLPGLYDVSALWLFTSFALGLAGAALGGYVCVAVARSVKAAKVLALAVLVLGFAFAVPALTTDAPSTPRVGDVSVTQAMQTAKQPTWVALLHPLVGAVGVLIGAGLKNRGSAAG